VATGIYELSDCFTLNEMKIVAFCDESSMSDIVSLTSPHALLCVVAHNRPAAQRLANELGVEWRIQNRNNTPDEQLLFRELEQFSPDIVLSRSYGLRIPRLILDLPLVGAINIHGGLLPEWRGANILNWVLIEGATETGVTAHWMTEGFDEGPIIARRTLSIDFYDTARTLSHKLRQLSNDILSSLLKDLEMGVVLPSEPQHDGQAKYYKRRTPEDGQIDWKKSNREIYNLIRALVTPWPGAYTVTESGTKVVFTDLVPYESIEALRHMYSKNSLTF